MRTAYDFYFIVVVVVRCQLLSFWDIIERCMMALLQLILIIFEWLCQFPTSKIGYERLRNRSWNIGNNMNVLYCTQVDKNMEFAKKRRKNNRSTLKALTGFSNQIWRYFECTFVVRVVRWWVVYGCRKAWRLKKSNNETISVEMITKVKYRFYLTLATHAHSPPKTHPSRTHTIPFTFELIKCSIAFDFPEAISIPIQPQPVIKSLGRISIFR